MITEIRNSIVCLLFSEVCVCEYFINTFEIKPFIFEFTWFQLILSSKFYFVYLTFIIDDSHNRSFKYSIFFLIRNVKAFNLRLLKDIKDSMRTLIDSPHLKTNTCWIC